MSEQIALPKDGKTFSKSGVTGAVIAASGGFDLAQQTVIPMLTGGNAELNWVSVVAFVGGCLVALFRKFSDGKFPKLV